MSADPVVVLGVLMAHLRGSTALGRVPVDGLWAVVDLVDRILRHLGVESDPDMFGGLALACIADTPNPRAVRHLRCQHGTGPGVCDLCPAGEHEEVPPWRPQSSPRWTISGSRSRQRLTARRDSRRPAGRSR